MFTKFSTQIFSLVTDIVPVSYNIRLQSVLKQKVLRCIYRSAHCGMALVGQSRYCGMALVGQSRGFIYKFSGKLEVIINIICMSTGCIC
jgi:hypothetical protein